VNKETYPLVVPNLLFNGQCAKALELYKQAFGATVKEKILFCEANPEDFQYKNENEKDFIYYVELMIGNYMVMMSDGAGGMLGGTDGTRRAITSLCVSFDSEDKAMAAYQILSDGAEILMPVSSNSFCTFYATLTDKFGITWDLYFGDA